ncbi:MAG: hypothetical protein FWD83_05750 [Promicromonosporaceae bacterium]|nr:hypothetical protein [Promicromonosporaceae bacterium]
MNLRENKRADRVVSRRTGEPWRWALFGAGGQVAAVVMPALVIVFGLLIPFAGRGDDKLAYERFSSLLANPVVALLVFGGLGVVLWHCCHRIYHALHDLQIEPPKWVRTAIYAVAVLVPLAGWVLTALG